MKFLRGNQKPHLGKILCSTITKRSQLKNKALKSKSTKSESIVPFFINNKTLLILF